MLVHIFSTFTVIVIFSLPQSPPCFPHLSEHFFLLCTTFAAWTSCDQIGNDISEQTQASQYCEAQPVPSTEPNPKALCLKPKPLVWKRFGLFFFFFHWCKSQLESENKNPLTSPKAHVWYFIVSGYGSKVSFTICLHVTHWKWLADGNSIILQTCILRSWHPSWLTRHISKFLISTTVTSVSFVENYYNLRTGVANLVL